MQEQVIQPEQQLEIIPPKSFKKKSEFLEEYLEKMLPVKCQEVETMTKELSSHGIALIQGFADKLKKIVKNKEGNSIVFLVTMGNFAITLSLLKVHKSVSAFRRKKLAGGAFSDVFFERVGKN